LIRVYGEAGRREEKEERQRELDELRAGPDQSALGAAASQAGPPEMEGIPAGRPQLETGKTL